MATVIPFMDSTSLHMLLRQPTLFLQVFEAMKDGVMVCDAQGHIILTNSALRQQLQLSEDTLHQPYDEMIQEPVLWDAIERAREKNASFMAEIEMGHSFFQLHVIPLTLPEGLAPCDGFVVMFHDMTAVHRMEKMRRDFVANVSHELRTPLTAIDGYAETLLDGALKEEAVSKEFVSIIHKHSQRLTHLVNDLLDLSKLESPDYQLDKMPLDLHPLVTHVLMMANSAMAGKSLSYEVCLPEELPRVLGNLGTLEQVFTNLVDNAIKYSPNGSMIRISADVIEGHKVQVDITDTGNGIEPKHIPRLFERFYRIDKGRSRDLGGTGLGLAIVKHIIQLHSGDVWVSSEPNQGSTFSFTLPVA